MAKNKNSKRGNLKKKKGGGGKKKPKTFQHNAKVGLNLSATSLVGVDNPFEIRVNKRKHDNLGRRGRNEQGVPGVSRSRAVEKRKATLLKEYKVRNKSNSLQDKRIGEKGRGIPMPEEEKFIRRSAAEKKRQFKQKSIFNLQDTDELLTHKGQPLLDVDRYEDPREGSDSDEERLDADFVTDANFGGFMKMKKGTPEDEDEGGSGPPKSHKQLLQELILESKKKKAEKAKEADENYELVSKLDEDFKNPDIRDLLFFAKKKNEIFLTSVTEEVPTTSSSSTENKREEREEYDMLVKELQFEAKAGRATDRLKTEEEVAEEEKDKLIQLERERLKRMQMTDGSDPNVRQHRSADDLDDGYTLESEVIPENATASDEEDEDDEDDGEEEEGEDGSDDDGFSDVAESEDEEEGEESVIAEGTKEEIPNVEYASEPSKFSEEIPFVLAVPSKFKDFETLLKKYSAHYKSKSKMWVEACDLILTRMIKYNKVSDRSKLPKLFNFIIRYVLDCAEKLKKFCPHLLKLNASVLSHLHSLLLLNPSECVNEVENGEIFDDFYSFKGLPVNRLVYFNICSKLFSASDFHHRVLSPIKVSLLDILSRTKATNMTILAKLFYVMKVIYDLSKDAKRYTPEVINVLSSILECYLGDEKRWHGFAIPSIRHAKDFLFISIDECSVDTLVNDGVWAFVCDDAKDNNTDVTVKLGVLSATLFYIQQYATLYKNLPSSVPIFQSIRKALTQLADRKSWPTKISDALKSTLDTVSNLKNKSEPLVVAVSNKPRMLKLYEPLVDEDFDGVHKKKAPKGKKVTARLTHKVKQEMKNAVREIKKDTAFLAKQQLKEELQKDSERKRKVKEILGSLANQEGEYKKFKRMKDK